jgi:hypothetical protein
MFDTKSEVRPVCRMDAYNLKVAAHSIIARILCSHFCCIFYRLLTAVSPHLLENKLNRSFSSSSNAMLLTAELSLNLHEEELINFQQCKKILFLYF